MEPNFAIDPLLPNLGTTAASLKLPKGLDPLSEHDGIADVLNDRQLPAAPSEPDSAAPFTGSKLLMKAAPSLGISEIHSTEVNDFDVLFKTFDELEDNEALDVYAASHLALWIAKNRSIKLSAKQLKDFEGITAIPVHRLSRWLPLYGKTLLASAQARRVDRKVRKSYVKCATYRVRCTTSEFRYRTRNAGTCVTKLFECTNRCGQTFERKGDWSRHEKVNFEEWICPSCGKALSRRDKLREHVKDCHVGVRFSKLDKQVFLESKQRACGFCGDTLPLWAAWLTHVASHFEGSAAGGRRDMSHWQEYRTPGETKEALDGSLIPVENQQEMSPPLAQIDPADDMVMKASKDLCKDLYVVVAGVACGVNVTNTRLPMGVSPRPDEDDFENTTTRNSSPWRGSQRSRDNESKRRETYYNHDRERQPEPPRSRGDAFESRDYVSTRPRFSRPTWTYEDRRAALTDEQRRAREDRSNTDHRRYLDRERSLPVRNYRTRDEILESRIDARRDAGTHEEVLDTRTREASLDRQTHEAHRDSTRAEDSEDLDADYGQRRIPPAHGRAFDRDPYSHDTEMASLGAQFSGTQISRTMDDVVHRSAYTQQHGRNEANIRQNATQPDRSREAQIDRSREAQTDRSCEAQINRRREAQINRGRKAQIERSRKTRIERTREAQVERSREARIERTREAQVDQTRNSQVDRTREAYSREPAQHGSRWSR